MGDTGVVGVAVGKSVEVTVAAAIVKGDLLVSSLITVARHTLNSGILHHLHPEESRRTRNILMITSWTKTVFSERRARLTWIH